MNLSQVIQRKSHCKNLCETNMMITYGNHFLRIYNKEYKIPQHTKKTIRKCREFCFLWSLNYCLISKRHLAIPYYQWGKYASEKWQIRQFEAPSRLSVRTVTTTRRIALSLNMVEETFQNQIDHKILIPRYFSWSNNRPNNFRKPWDVYGLHRRRRLNKQQRWREQRNRQRHQWRNAFFSDRTIGLVSVNCAFR